MSPEQFMRRRQRQVVTYVFLHPSVKRAAEYGVFQFDKQILRRLGTRETGRTAKVLFGATRIGGRVATKGIPIVGWVSLGYDVVQFGKWVRDRRS